MISAINNVMIFFTITDNLTANYLLAKTHSIFKCTNKLIHYRIGKVVKCLNLIQYYENNNKILFINLLFIY